MTEGTGDGGGMVMDGTAHWLSVWITLLLVLPIVYAGPVLGKFTDLSAVTFVVVFVGAFIAFNTVKIAIEVAIVKHTRWD